MTDLTYFILLFMFYTFEKRLDRLVVLWYTHIIQCSPSFLQNNYMESKLDVYALLMYSCTVYLGPIVI